MEEAKQIYDFILEFWRLVKKYCDNPPTNEEEWDMLTDEAGKLREKHNTDEARDIFNKGVIFAWFDYLAYKERRKQEV